MKQLLLGLAALTTVSAAQAVTFSSPKEGYAITVPANWTQGSYPGASVIFMAPKALPGFHPNMNVMVQSLPQGMTLGQYHEVSLAQIPQAFTEGKVLRVVKTTLGGVPAYDVTYQGQLKSDKDKLLFEAVYAVKGQRAYLITTTTLLSQPATLPPMKQFVSGFKFLP